MFTKLRRVIRPAAALRAGILVAVLGALITGVAGQPVPLTITSVGIGPTCPVVGGLASWTATSVGGIAPVEYQFWLRNDTAGSWTLLRDYGPGNAANWTPTTAGVYFTQVWARSAGSTVALEAWLNSDPCVVTAPTPVRVTSVTATPPSVLVLNPIVWTVSATGGVAPLNYQFWLRNQTAGTWTLLQDYSTASTATWTPTTAGSYFVQAWVRSAGSADAFQAWSNSLPVTVYLVPPPTTLSSVTVTPASPLSLGLPATWVASASGGVAPLKYQFWLRNQTAGTWTLLQDYGTASTAPWTPATAGTYYVQVRVRSAGSAAPWEAVSNSSPVVVSQGPSPPQWTVVVSDPGSQTIAWAVNGLSSGYRVYRASSREALLGRLPTAPFIQVSAPPLVVNISDPNVPQYYRVFGSAGALIGEGGPVAVSTAVQTVELKLLPVNTSGGLAKAVVTPGLWDVDGDGCLDLLGGRGTCDGRFEPYPLDVPGLAGLFSPGRVNRDSRFADFNGDGRVDIFTNVYADARDSQSRAILHLGNGTGGFTEDLAMRGMAIGGFGETVVAADVDNDGDIDLFLPNYSHTGDGGHNWLLINDGGGHFTDVAASAGVALNEPNPKPEAAQAIDFDQDGWLDLLVSSHLYINNRNLTFTDRAAAFKLPKRFDEGMKFLDIDLDGDFDLVHHNSQVTRLYRNVGGVFDGGADVDGGTSTYGFGLNVCDVNGDGFEDVIVANNDVILRTGAPHLLINMAGTLRRTFFPVAAAAYNDVVACADVDRSGLPDVVSRWTNTLSGFRTLINRASSGGTIRLRVLGRGGERNQQGRIVRLRPAAAANRTLLRVVESGSGYMAQNDYDLLIAAPWPGDYQVSVLFSDGEFVTTARPGDDLTIYADHRVEPTAPPLPKLTSVTATPASSGPIGAPVTWRAQARFGVAPLEYRFWLCAQTAGTCTWTMLRDYAVASTATWTPATAGTYFVQVWVRSAGSTAELEGWLNSSVFVASAPP